MSGTGDGGETSATGGTTPASLDPASSASADATVEGELSRDAQNEILQEKSCSAPPSPSKVLGAGKNSAPSFSLPRSAARTPREQDTASDVGTKVPGVAATHETRSEHTLSEFAAGIQEDAQREAASTGMEQAMTGLLDPSHKKVETPKLPRDFATKCPSSDADPLDGGVMDDPVIWSSGYVDRLHGGVMDDPVTLSSGYFTESSDYQVQNDSMLDKLMILGSTAEIDSTEELFHHIKSLKDEYLYKLMELDRAYTVPNLPEGDKTEEFSNRVGTKRSIRKVLEFLQVEKCNVHEGLKEKLPEHKAFIEYLMSVKKNESDELLRTMSWKEQQQQQAQPADASPFPINSPEGQVQREVAETLVAKNPSDRLRCAIRSSSSGALRSSVRSVVSVLRERDSVPLGAFLDLTSSQQLGGSSNMNKLKCVFDHSLPTQSTLFGSMDGFDMPFEGDSSDSESSGVKRQKMQNTNSALVEEIEAINRTLIDTEITIAGDSRNDGITSSRDTGTTIKLSYTAVALSADLKNLFESSEECVVMPAQLSVPPDYPRSSPMLITDNGADQLRKTSSSISVSVHAAFPLALENLPEPRSIKDIARAWDTCVRRAVTEYARQYGGGTWSSAFGRWERCSGS